MSESGGLDIGRVIGMIMENPELVAQIAAMAKSSPPPQPTDASLVEEVKSPPKEDAQAISPAVVPSATYTPQSSAKIHRTQLLGALKPYVSEERAKAIDSMLTIADILDMMKAR